MNQLAWFGFYINADEVVSFKQSGIENSNNENNDINVSFRRCIADNVDHNTGTLTGKGTFHGRRLFIEGILPLLD